MKTVLILGGTRFLGHEVVEALIFAGYDVTTCSRKKSKAAKVNSLIIERQNITKEIFLNS